MMDPGSACLRGSLEPQYLSHYTSNIGLGTTKIFTDHHLFASQILIYYSEVENVCNLNCLS